jgi:hypothetical protein
MIINRKSLDVRDGHATGDGGGGGFVEVTINGETRNMRCGTFDDRIFVQNISGRFGRSSKWWPLRVVSHANRERIEVFESPAPTRLRDRIPDEIKFTSATYVDPKKVLAC